MLFMIKLADFVESFVKKTKESLWPQQADPVVNQTVYEEKLFNETDRAIIR